MIFYPFFSATFENLAIEGKCHVTSLQQSVKKKCIFRGYLIITRWVLYFFNEISSMFLTSDTNYCCVVVLRNRGKAQILLMFLCFWPIFFLVPCLGTSSKAIINVFCGNTTIICVLLNGRIVCFITLDVSQTFKKM